jgi:hypothetical protein
VNARANLDLINLPLPADTTPTAGIGSRAGI